MPTVNKLMLLGCATCAPTRERSFDGKTAILTIQVEESEAHPDIPASGITILLTAKQADWGVANITKGTTVHVEAQLQPLGRTARGASVAYLVAQSVQIVAQHEKGIAPSSNLSSPASPASQLTGLPSHGVH